MHKSKNSNYTRLNSRQDQPSFILTISLQRCVFSNNNNLIYASYTIQTIVIKHSPEVENGKKNHAT